MRVADVQVVDGDEIVVRLNLLDEILSVHGSLHIPLDHVRSVSADPVPSHFWRGMRVGTNVPGVIVAGTFMSREGTVFYDVRHLDRCITLELEHDHYDRVVVEVDGDPAEVAAKIRSAMGRDD